MLLRRLIPYITAIVVMVGPLTLTAKEISGNESPEYKMAVEAWLNGEDMHALGKLGQLSRDGNTAAQLLLASLAVRSNMHVHVTSALSRKDRIELLRIPKGLSGKSWLSEAQKVDPLATALLQSSKTGEKAPAIAALIEFGEPNIALLAVQSMLWQGQAKELIQVLQGLDKKLPEDSAVLLDWALRQAANPVNGRNVGSARVGTAYLSDRKFQAAELTWLGFGPHHIVEHKELRGSVLKHYDKVRSWKPVLKHCQKSCPESVPSCVALGVSTLWLAGPLAMRSPLESAVSDELYWSSPRIEGDLARQIQDVRQLRDWDGIAEVNSCFLDSMEVLQSVHGYAR